MWPSPLDTEISALASATSWLERQEPCPPAGIICDSQSVLDVISSDDVEYWLTIIIRCRARTHLSCLLAKTGPYRSFWFITKRTGSSGSTSIWSLSQACGVSQHHRSISWPIMPKMQSVSTNSGTRATNLPGHTTTTSTNLRYCWSATRHLDNRSAAGDPVRARDSLVTRHVTLSSSNSCLRTETGPYRSLSSARTDVNKYKNFYNSQLNPNNRGTQTGGLLKHHQSINKSLASICNKCH